MFTKDKRSTFPYWFAHWCAYNMTALTLKRWKFRYLFHDIEKPWMLLWFKYIIKDPDPYTRVQTWHRLHNRHHWEHPKVNHVDMLIDWECSRFTKEASSKTAVEVIAYRLKMVKLALGKQMNFSGGLKK